MTSQKLMVKDHLEKYGTITSVIAYKRYGITRLASIIKRLRNKGYEIDSIWRTEINRFGTKCRFVEYQLMKGDDTDGRKKDVQ